MKASTVEAIAERLEILEAERDLLSQVLRDVRQLARAALVDIAVETEAAQRHEMASTLNAISTRIAAAQQALRVTEDAEHKTGHEKDDAETLAWAASVGLANLEPAARIRALAARRRANARLAEQDGGGTDASAVTMLHAGVGPVTTTRNADRPLTSTSTE